ncbi:MAG: isopentenyl-diphosphate Delta-isomerase [Gemmatimonadaceae bacterium]|nr:isopentenyl-diphosphate Delta-isomerase [Gemmatimonadaceae bacterium]
MSDPTEALEVILVDADDRPIGVCEKLDAHRRGLLHRAVSVFAFAPDGRLLVQQRARAKYHSGGQWSNTACTHPRIGESLEGAARRGAREELGIELHALQHAWSFTYRATVGDGLVEHELDHVFIAEVRDAARPALGEVEAVDFVSLEAVIEAAVQHPESWTPWFRLLIRDVAAWRAIASRAAPGA